MGVRGLRSYMLRNNQLKDSELSNQKVIIDGSNLCHFLNDRELNENFQGSDYCLFARNCRRFFQALKQCGVRPYVIIDGGRNPDNRHFRCTLKRKQSRIDDCQRGQIGHLPIFAEETFRQILKELDIPFATTFFEADTDIAVLANMWRCPVMSGDSDFFIYPLEEGCVLFPLLNQSSSFENNEIRVKSYRYDSFVREKGTFADALPLLATIMSNDYVDRTLLLKFYRSQRWLDNKDRPDDILAWLERFRHSSDKEARVLGSVLTTEGATNKTAEAFSLAIADYKSNEFTSFDLDSFFRANVHKGASLNDYYGNKLPDWLDSSFLQDVFLLHRVIFTCQGGENIDQSSSFACSRYIRQCIYGIAAAAATPGNLDIFVVEHDRKGNQCWPFVVVPVREVRHFGKLPDFHTISDMGLGDRQRLFLACFDVRHHNLDGLDVNDAIVPLILCMSFWMKHAYPVVNENHLDAILMCVIYLHMKAVAFKEDYQQMSSSIVDSFNETGQYAITSMQKQMFKKFDYMPDDGWDITVMHSFAQLYSCYKDTCRLNKALNKPFRVSSPAVLFNSKFVYNFYMALVSTRSTAEDMSGLSRGPHYSKLRRLFMVLRGKVVQLSLYIKKHN